MSEPFFGRCCEPRQKWRFVERETFDTGMVVLGFEHRCAWQGGDGSFMSTYILLSEVMRTEDGTE